MSTAAALRVNLGQMMAAQDARLQRIIRFQLSQGRLDMVEDAFGSGWAQYLRPAEPVKAVTR